MTTEYFTNGSCLYFALAFHEKFGGKFRVLRDEKKSDVPFPNATNPVPHLHTWVELPNGEHYDARGKIDPDEILNVYVGAYEKRPLFRAPDYAIFDETLETMGNLFHCLHDDRKDCTTFKKQMRDARKFLAWNRDRFPSYHTDAIAA